MECGEWKTILTQWVNCLKLIRPVLTLEDLRNGDFFINLTSTLDSPIQVRSMYDVVRLIQQSYPNFDLSCYADLESKTTESIVVFCSVLLHYSCVVKRNEVFMKVLCNNLPQNAQLSIRTFLEKFTCDMTMEKLRTIISDCVKIESDELGFMYDWKPTGDSLLTGQSPLQNLLSTPHLTLKERDHQIKKLQAKLELERFEKSDCLEEIKTQKETIQRLSNQLKEKCNAICKLRDELYLMQNTSLSDCQKLSTCDVEKQLRSEVKNLELYISQLRAEQDDLQDDKEKIFKQLKRSKEEAKLWQEKAVSAENNCDELTEKYAQQTQELGQLKLQCNEMSALLKELRPLKRRSTSYLDSPVLQKSYSVMENSSEDLAHAIIEVQLKDAEKENAELQATLTEALQRGDSLQKDLSVASVNYQELKKNFTELQTSNNELTIKMSELNEAQTQLCDCNKELNGKVCELLELNEHKDDELSTLRIKLENVSASHKEITSLNDALQNDLQIKQSERDEIEAELFSTTDKYTNIRKEANALQKKYEVVIESYNESTFKLNSWKANYELLDKNMSVSLEKLGNIICGENNQVDFEDKSLAFAVLLQRVEDFKTQQNNDKVNLQNAVLRSEQQVSVLKQEMLSLTQQETINRRLLEDSLKAAELNLNNLQQIISNKSEEIKQLNHTVLELNGTIKELSLLKDALAKKDNQLTEMQEEKRISKELFRNKIRDFELKLSARDDVINDYTYKQSVINRELEEARELKEIEKQAKKDNLEKERQHLERTQLLNLQIQDYLERIARLENDLSASKEENNEKVNELINLEQTQRQVEADYEATKSDLSKKNELITETIRKLEIELQIIMKEKENLQKSLEDLASDNKIMMDDRNVKLKEAEDLKGQVKTYLERIKNIEGDCAQKDTVISENNKELLNLKLELEAKKQAYKRLQESAEKLTLEAKSYVLCIDTLKTQNAEFNSNINELSNEIMILNNLKAGLEKKNKEFESNTEKIIAYLSSTNEELNIAIEGLALDKQESENEMRSLNASLDEANKNLEDLTKERTSIKQKYEDNILLLTEEVTSLKNEIFDLKSREVECLHDLTSTKDELSKAISKYTDSLMLLQEVKSENECQITNLTENLHCIIEKYNKLESAHQESLEELKQITGQLGEVESEKISLEVKIVRQKQKYEEELELTTEQLTNDIKNLSNKQGKLELALGKASDDLEKERGIRYRLENDVKKLQTKLNVLEQEKADLSETVDSLRRSKLQLDADYESLQLTYGSYISESENNIRKLETDCYSEMQKLKTEKDVLRQQVTVLENAMSSLQSENESNRRFHEETIRNNETFIAELKQKISNHEVNLAKITEEQNLLRRQVEVEKQNHIQLNAALQRNEEEKNSYENRISKLKCAYDILHTGKSKLELEYESLLETCNNIEQEKLFNEVQLREKLKLNEDEIVNLSKEVEVKNELVLQKDEAIAEVTSKLHKMNLIIETLEDEVAKSKEFHDECLTKIEEENQSKIAEMSSNLQIMMQSHEDLSKENAQLKMERDRFREESQAYLTKQNYLEKIINEKELNLNEYVNRIALREESFTQQEHLIAHLQNDLQNLLSEAELLNKEKVKLEGELEKTRTVVTKLENSYGDIVESQEKTVKETEASLFRAHEDAMKIKNELLVQVEEANVKAADAENARRKIEELLQKEREAKGFLEIRTLTLTNEKYKCTQLYLILRRSIQKISELIEEEVCMSLEDAEENNLKITTAEIEQRIAEIYQKQRNITQVISGLQENKNQTELKLCTLEKERAILNADKERLLQDYNAVVSEKENSLENLQSEMNYLRKRYEENLEVNRAFEINNNELQQKMLELKENNIKAYNEYQEFVGESKAYKQAFDQIVNESNTTEVVINDLKKKLLDVQLRYLSLKPEPVNKQQFERKEALEVISEDIQKQFKRYSNILHRYQMGVAEISMKVADAILTEKNINWKKLLNDLDVEEVALKMGELKERAADALDQCRSLEEVKSGKALKENTSKLEITQNVDWKKQEDDWKRKCTVLKQKLTLTEHVKSNYEKKLKQLRDENKRLSTASTNKQSDERYQVLLQQHIQAKEEHIKIIKESNSKYERLLHEYEKCKFINNKPEETGKIEGELKKVREAYAKVLSENAKLEQDRNTLQKLLDNQSSERTKLAVLSERNERLMEANKKLELRVKMLKEKDDFIKALKKEIDSASERENGRVQEVRIEYENKLEKMKEKMIKMYREEVQREIEKLSSEKTDNAILLHSLERYKTELDKARQTISNLKQASNESSSTRSGSSDSDRSVQSSKNKSALEGKRSTMPKGFAMSVIEEDRISTIHAANMSHNLKMEDEGELFNNKYLSDLKEGKCVVPELTESRKGRLSELVWRNSLCPPHLKSSYPAETQFATPTLFKEDDLRSGNIDFDDSMSSKLLPGEKPRKKDIGTTSYKKPGPPTPSKNGGRLSLQGSEQHVLREHNEPKTPKRTTPSRLKALFLGRSTSAQDENQPNTPRTKRLNSIFRKPR